MNAADEQEEGERAIFGLFAEAAGLHCSSIESRRPPEPDILCEVVGHGPLAFELGEVVNPEFERALSEQRRVRNQFRDSYNALGSEVRQRIEKCLGGPPAIIIGFAVGPGRWQRAVKPILDFLVGHADATGEERLRPGDIPVWRYSALSSLVSEMAVRSSTLRKPFLGAAEAVEVFDATATLLEKKFQRRYETAAPIELIVYCRDAGETRTSSGHRCAGLLPVVETQ